VTLDPATYAVRSDLADIRLAALVFAPHYAAPVAYAVATACPLRAERSPGSAVLGEVPADALFEVLDLVGDGAWGVAPSLGKAGWINRAALGARA